MRYAKYKKTGIPWLPEVPEEWEQVRAKYAFRKEQRPVLPGDDIVTCFRDGEVTLRKNRRTTGFTEATDYSHYQHICKGDLVIHQMDAFAGSTGVSVSDGMGTPVLSVCTPKSECYDVPYYAKIVRHMGLNGYIHSLYRGIRERSSDFRFDTFSKQWLPHPPLPTQRAIVAHLDAQCGKIDSLVAAKEKEIELLKELKQATIAEAVTGKVEVEKRGGGGRRRLKPSGIPWLPQVPEGWEVKRVASILKVKDCPSAPNEELLSVFLDRGVIRFNEGGEKRANATSKDLSKYQLVEIGDFVMNNQQAWRGSVGVSNYRGIISPAYFVVQMNVCLDRKYANFAFRSWPFVSIYEMCSRGVGSIQRNLIWNKFKQHSLPVPPHEEQERIVAYVERETAKIDSAAADLTKQVAALKEYKQRLIADVVTGQEKVVGGW